MAIDLVGPFAPMSERGHHFILIIVDVATRVPEAVPLKHNIYSGGIVVNLCPEILSDRGTQFTSDLMKEIFRLLSVDHLTTSPYHAQTNGMVERFNGTLKTMLRKMSSEKPKDLNKYISALLFSYREMPKDSTGFSSFELLYGRTPQTCQVHSTWSCDHSSRSLSGSKQNQEVKTIYLPVRS